MFVSLNVCNQVWHELSWRDPGWFTWCWCSILHFICWLNPIYQYCHFGLVLGLLYWSGAVSPYLWGRPLLVICYHHGLVQLLATKLKIPVRLTAIVRAHQLSHILGSPLASLPLGNPEHDIPARYLILLDINLAHGHSDILSLIGEFTLDEEV